MNQHLRTALRFATYIRCMGGDPIPFRHGSHREWGRDLQRQHERLRQGLAPDRAKAAKVAARELIRRKGYRKAAGEVAPVKVVASDTRNQSRGANLAGENAIDQTVGVSPAAEDKSCRRKLFHQDFWSALLHARHLGTGVRVYPCGCGGFHVGHLPTDERTRQFRRASKRLRTIERRLVALDREWIALVREKTALLRQVGEPAVLGIMISEIAKHLRRLVRIFGV